MKQTKVSGIMLLSFILNTSFLALTFCSPSERPGIPVETIIRKQILELTKNEPYISALVEALPDHYLKNLTFFNSQKDIVYELDKLSGKIMTYRKSNMLSNLVSDPQACLKDKIKGSGSKKKLAKELFMGLARVLHLGSNVPEDFSPLEAIDAYTAGYKNSNYVAYDLIEVFLIWISRKTSLTLPSLEKVIQLEYTYFRPHLYPLNPHIKDMSIECKFTIAAALLKSHAILKSVDVDDPSRDDDAVKFSEVYSGFLRHPALTEEVASMLRCSTPKETADMMNDFISLYDF